MGGEQTEVLEWVLGRRDDAESCLYYARSQADVPPSGKTRWLVGKHGESPAPKLKVQRDRAGGDDGGEVGGEVGGEPGGEEGDRDNAAHGVWGRMERAQGGAQLARVTGSGWWVPCAREN